MQRLTLATLMLAALAAVGCGDDGEAFNPGDPPTPDDPSDPIPFDPGTQALIRAFHAAPGAPALDVLVSDAPIADALGFGQNSPYTATAAGTAVLLLRSDPDNEDLFAVEEELAAGASYSVMVTGGDAGILPVLLPDDNAAPPSGQAKIRTVHAVASVAEAVDVYVTAPGADLGTVAATFTDVRFGAPWCNWQHA